MRQHLLYPGIFIVSPMRESRKTEKTHLPKSSTELWLETQTVSQKESKHSTPPRDTYEAWVGKRVEESLARKQVAKDSL